MVLSSFRIIQRDFNEYGIGHFLKSRGETFIIVSSQWVVTSLSYGGGDGVDSGDGDDAIINMSSYVATTFF